MSNHIFYIIGESGSGKDTIYNMVLDFISSNKENNLNIKPIVVNTTRPIRKNEIDGITYNFVTKDKYMEDRKNDKIAEKRSYVVVGGVWIYYTSKDAINLKECSHIGIGTLESFYSLRKIYGTEVMIPIYIQVSDDGERLKRLITREQNQPENKRNYREICRRYVSDGDDFVKSNQKRCFGECKPHIILNDSDVNDSFNEVINIIKNMS